MGGKCKKIQKCIASGTFLKGKKTGINTQKKGEKALDNRFQKCYNSLEFGEKHK
jgi:hypothetical protein